MLSPLASAIGQECFASKVVRCNYENTVWLRIADVNDFQISTARRLTNSYAGAVSPWPIFSRTPQDLLRLFFIHTVAPDMWFTRCGIEVEANIHRHQYRKYRLYRAS